MAHQVNKLKPHLQKYNLMEKNINILYKSVHQAQNVQTPEKKLKFLEFLLPLHVKLMELTDHQQLIVVMHLP